MSKSERAPVIRRVVMLVLAVAGGVGVHVVAMPRWLMACSPPPPQLEVLTLVLDTVMVDGPTPPDVAAYQGFEVHLMAEGPESLSLVAQDAAQRSFWEFYQRVR